MPTNLPKRLLAALVFAPLYTSAQVDMDFWDRKSWVQIGEKSSLYLGGWTDISFQDGSYELAGCAFHPSFSIVGPNIFCPLGTNGFSAKGDIDGNGVDDTGAFWSFASVIGAARVEPYRVDRFRIAAAPPSGLADLARANDGAIENIFSVEDKSSTIWFDVLAPPIGAFDITRYEGHRHYDSGNDELQRHYYDIPWGTYIFELPQLLPVNATPEEVERPRPVPFSVDHQVAPDAYPGRAGIAQGWRLLNTNWRDGRLRDDPRSFLSFEWSGLNPSNTFLSDNLLFSMRGNQYVRPPQSFFADPSELPSVSEIPPRIDLDGEVTGLSCLNFDDPWTFEVTAVGDLVISGDVDFEALLTPGTSYFLRMTSGVLAGEVFQVDAWGDPGMMDLTITPDPDDPDGPPVLSESILPGDAFTLSPNIPDPEGTFNVVGVTETEITADVNMDGLLEDGARYIMRLESALDPAITASVIIDEWGAPTAADIVTPFDLSADFAAGDTFTLQAIDPAFNEFVVDAVAGTTVTTNQDLSLVLEEGGAYVMQIVSGSLAGTTWLIQLFGDPTEMDITTPEDLSSGLEPGDRFLLSGLSGTIVESTINVTEALNAGSTYEMRITSGDFKDESLHTLNNGPPSVQHPIEFFGPLGENVLGLELTDFEFLTPNDISGGLVTGEVTDVDGTTVTTNRNLANCLSAPSYRMIIKSGSLSGTSIFPINEWGNPSLRDLTTPEALGLAAGDRFELHPEIEVVTSTIETVAGFFIKADLNTSSLARGVAYEIEFSSGPLAGKSEQVRSFGFPDVFWIETHNDLSSSLEAGHTYMLKQVSEPIASLKIGDTFKFSQRFGDWVQDKFDAGEMLAVDQATLEADPFFGGFGIPATLDLFVGFGFAGPLFAVAREDVITFPPYPIQTPPGDRSEVLINVADTRFELGPFFFQPGDSATGRLTLTRSSSVADVSEFVERFFNFGINFIDTYEGFALLGGLTGQGFPFGTPASERAPDYDFDLDGASNLMEFALQTDVADPSDTPDFRYVQGDQPGECMASITKRPFIGGSISYFFEYSTDLVNWTTIEPGDDTFEIVEDSDTTLTVSNFEIVGDDPPSSCFLRVKIVLN